METMESCVPPGFRFHPTDDELVGYYLKKKVASQKIDLDVIRDIDLYRIEPWDLQERCRIGYEEQNEWYFFSHKDKKYPTGTRTNRATMAGFWKATGRDKAVYEKMRLIGMRKTLVFYRGRAPNGQKTDWIMHEYRLESDENGPPQEEGWVVCRAFKKRTNNTQTKSNESGWESSSSYFYDDQPSGNVLLNSSSSSSIHENMDYISPRVLLPLHQNYMICKQEILNTSTTTEQKVDNSSFNNFLIMNSSISSDHHHLLQLPELESPSLPLMKRPSSLVSLISSENEGGGGGDNDHQVSVMNRGGHVEEKVTDWRALDKFVASQLSQEDRYGNNIIDGEGVTKFGVLDEDFLQSSSSDMDQLLLMHSGYSSSRSSRSSRSSSSSSSKEERNKLMMNGYFSSSAVTIGSSDCDNIGICIFDKLER